MACPYMALAEADLWSGAADCEAGKEDGEPFEKSYLDNYVA